MNQNLFNTIVNVTGFIPLESDMFEIIEAIQRDRNEEGRVDLLQAENERFQWSLKTFPEATALGALAKCREELKEIELDIVSGKRRPVEFADALMCLFDAAQRHGITLPDIFQAYKDKVELNKSRTWVKNPNGSYSHIADDKFDFSHDAVVVVSEVQREIERKIQDAEKRKTQPSLSQTK